MLTLSCSPLTPQCCYHCSLEQVNSVLKQQLAQSTEDLVLASMSVEDQEEGAAAPGPSGAADEGLTWKGLRPWVPQNLADRMKRLAEQMDVQRTKVRAAAVPFGDPSWYACCRLKKAFPPSPHAQELVAVVVELRRRFALIQTKLAEDHISHHNHVQQLQADLEVLARERDALSCTVQEVVVVLFAVSCGCYYYNWFVSALAHHEPLGFCFPCLLRVCVSVCVSVWSVSVSVSVKIKYSFAALCTPLGGASSQSRCSGRRRGWLLFRGNASHQTSDPDAIATLLDVPVYLSLCPAND